MKCFEVNGERMSKLSRKRKKRALNVKKDHMQPTTNIKGKVFDNVFT